MQIGNASPPGPTLSNTYAGAPVAKPADQDPNQLDNSSFKPVDAPTPGSRSQVPADTNIGKEKVQDEAEKQRSDTQKADSGERTQSDLAKQLAAEHVRQEQLKQERVQKEKAEEARRKEQHQSENRAEDQKALAEQQQRQEQDKLQQQKKLAAQHAAAARFAEIRSHTLGFTERHLAALEEFGTQRKPHVDQSA